MRIAVIGAGLFGCTMAIQAARAGHEVHLYDKSRSIMASATFCNQFRLHRGYHYPRSMETGAQCRSGNSSFYEEYRAAVITPDERKRGEQIYAIARAGSKVDGAAYLKFLEASELPYRIRERREPLLDPDALEMAVSVLESGIDYDILSSDVRRKLEVHRIVMHLETPVTAFMRSHFDRIVIACYAGTNKAALALGCEVKPLQFEVVEKPVIRLPKKYAKTGIVVMDGEFCSVDPYGRTGLHVMGHVKHAIWHSNTGNSAEIPEPLTDCVDQGIVEKPSLTRFDAMRSDAARYLPFVQDAEHVGSMYTVRAVLPNVDATDERPTEVEALDDQVIRIFSGKLGTAVDAARSALFMMLAMGYKKAS